MPPGSSAMAKAGRPNFSFSRAATMPTTPGCQPSRRGDHDRALLLHAERGHRLGFGLRQRRQLDRLPLAVEPVEFGGDFAPPRPGRLRAAISRRDRRGRCARRH